MICTQILLYYYIFDKCFASRIKENPADLCRWAHFIQKSAKTICYNFLQNNKQIIAVLADIYYRYITSIYTIAIMSRSYRINAGNVYLLTKCLQVPRRTILCLLVCKVITNCFIIRRINLSRMIKLNQKVD